MLLGTKQGRQFRVLAAAGVWLLMLAGTTALVIGQDESGAAATAAAEPTVDQTLAVDQAAAALSMQSLQTIGFRKDMPIKDALRMLAQMYQKNIVPSAKVDGIVTVTNLYDVTFEEALQAVLGTNKYEMKGNFVQVYTNEEFRADKTRFENAVIPLYYINAAEAKELAKPLLSELGQIGVTSPAKLDTTPGQGGDTLAIRDRLVVSDYPEVIRKIKETLAEVDTVPPQVLIEVTVLEATLNEQTQFGIDFDTLNDLVSTIGQDGVSQRGMAGVVTPSLIATNPSTSGLNVGILNDNVQVFIRALEETTDTTVLANPKILALNKQAGKLIIGRQDGYKSAETLSTGGNSTQTVTFLESGTVLEFRPFVGRDGLIRMELRPEQSNGTVQASGLPYKTTTEVLTNIMVRDGKTLVLGGLFQEKTTRTKSQVPLFGDIPLLGELFKSTNDKSERTELIVLITPHIVSEPEMADGADRMDDVHRLAYNARANLSWMSRAKLGEQRYAKAVEYYNAGNYDSALAELDGRLEYPMARNDLDPLRLKEKIMQEKQPDKFNQLERIMLGNIEKEQSGKWLRR